MREIKFRAWHKTQKEMFSRLYLTFQGQIGMWDNTETEIEFGDYPFLELMQYTGLKDKNGKEIYEGDIVKTHCFYQGLGENMGVIECEKEFISIVEYYQNDCAFVLVNTKDGDIYNFSQIEEPSEELEVIGNIYENPDLLKWTTPINTL